MKVEGGQLLVNDEQSSDYALLGYKGKPVGNSGIIYCKYIPIQTVSVSSTVMTYETMVKSHKNRSYLVTLLGCKSGGELSLTAAANGIKKLSQEESYLICGWYAAILADSKKSSKWLVDYAKRKDSIFRIGRTFANKFNTDKNKAYSKAFSDTMFKLTMIYWNTTVVE